MLELGLKYAFGISGVEKVTIGVFENNIPAYKCYKSIGFNEIATDCYKTETVNGEDCKIIELEITKADYINHNKRLRTEALTGWNLMCGNSTRVQ